MRIPCVECYAHTKSVWPLLIAAAVWGFVIGTIFGAWAKG